MELADFEKIWQLKDAIRTVVEANHFTTWDISLKGRGLLLELNEHLDEEAVNLLCGQFPLPADYEGEGRHGSRISLYF